MGLSPRPRPRKAGGLKQPKGNRPEKPRTFVGGAVLGSHPVSLVDGKRAVLSSYTLARGWLSCPTWLPIEVGAILQSHTYKRVVDHRRIYI